MHQRRALAPRRPHLGRRARSVLMAIALGAAAATSGCDDGPAAGADPLRTKGQSDFQTSVTGAGLPGGGQSNEASRGGSGAAGGPATGAPSPQAPAVPGSSDPDSVSGSKDPGRLVEEGDVVKVAGTTLYILNEYRGLQVVDVGNVDQPALLSREAGVLGKPEDMYLRGTMAIALVSDHRQYSRCVECSGGAQLFKGSAAAFIDVSNPRAATLRARIEIRGTVTDSRIVGNVLYVVSQQYTLGQSSILDDGKNATTVQAFDITDPAKPAATASVEIPRGGWQNHVHFTDKLLYLASSGYGSWAEGKCVAPKPAEPGTSGGTMGGTGTATPGSVPGVAPQPQPPSMVTEPTINFGPCSRLTAVDIAAADGTIQLGAHVDVPGLVLDRWSMDHHQGILRVVTAPHGNGVPRITTYRSGSAAELTVFGPGLNVPVPRPEELKAVRFDGTRAFVVTFQRIDPLFIIDLSNPEAPQTLGELETPGWVDHIEPRGDRLVALGHDQMNVTDGGRGWVLSASIYDVSDLRAPKLMSREIFGEGSSTIPDTRNNVHKVFRVIDDAKLILMPYRAYLPATPTVPFGGATVGRVQLLDFDLPSGQVVKRGAIAHDGGVERALLAGNNVLAVSPEKLQVVDIANRAEPRTRGVLRLTRAVDEVVPVAPGFVATVTPSEDGEQTLLELHPASDPNGPVTAPELRLPVMRPRVFASGALLYLVGMQRRFAEAGPSKGNPALLTQLIVVDTTAGKLVQRGTLALPRLPALDQRPTLGGVPLSAALVGGSSLVLTLPRESCGGSSVGGSGGPGLPVPTSPPPPINMPPSTMPASSRPDASAPVDVRPAADGATMVPPATSLTRSGLTGVAADIMTAMCPPHEADFLVVDLRNPDVPTQSAKLKIAGASDVMGAAVIGNTFYVDHFEQVPGFDELNRVIVAGVRYYVTRVDLSNPASPQLAPKINVPGVFIAERTSDRTWFTVEPRRDASTGAEQLSLHALYQPAGQARAYLESTLPADAKLPGRLVFGDRAAFGISDGQLLTINLADSRALSVGARTQVPGVVPGNGSSGVGAATRVAPGERPITFTSGWAEVAALMGDHLLLNVDGGALLFDVKDPVKPNAVGFVRATAGNAARLHLDVGQPAFLPAGLYGVAPLPPPSLQ